MPHISEWHELDTADLSTFPIASYPIQVQLSDGTVEQGFSDVYFRESTAGLMPQSSAGATSRTTPQSSLTCFARLINGAICRESLHLVSASKMVMVSLTDYILCVEFDRSLLESRCAGLKKLYYDVTPASPRLAEIVLSYRKFDLVITFGLDDHDLNRIINVSDGAKILALDAKMSESEVLSRVADWFRYQRRA